MTDDVTAAPETPEEALPADFETAMQELEALVESMENDRLTLDESLRQYKRGVALARRCQEHLAEAERQVKVLQEGRLVERDFTPDEDGADKGDT